MLSMAALAACALAPAAEAELYYVIVAGLGGEERYEDAFAEQAATLTTVANRTTGAERVTVLAGEKATREALTAALAALETQTKPTDSVALVLIGHGSFDGDRYKLNLPGPDIDAEGLAELLARLPARSQLVVNTSSASGAMLKPLEAEGRTLMSATRSGFERNATRFGTHFAAALSENAADINKNGIITAQEAFDFTERSVADSYTEAGALATEHPQLVGDAAARFTVARLTAQAEPATPALARLEGEKRGLEEEIEGLRLRREELGDDAYFTELQKLLVELAEVQEQIDSQSTDP
jgi:hypothetical protein